MNKFYLKTTTIIFAIIWFTSLTPLWSQCLAPTGITSTPGISPNGLVNVVFNWDAVTGADHYFLLYRESGEVLWQKVRTSSTSFFVDGLIANTDYDWGLSTFCDEEETLQSSWVFGNFTTLNGISCEAPTGFTATPGVSSNGFANVTFTWDAVAAADHYLVLWRVNGTSTWQKARPTTNSLTVNGLASNTLYDWGIFTACTADETAKSVFTSGTFTTGMGTSCDAPTGLSTTPGVSANGLVNVTFNWDAQATADRYQVIWRLQGASNWRSRIVTNNTLFVEGLAGLRNYDWGVKSLCNTEGTIQSNFTFSSFTTLSGPCDVPSNLMAVPGTSSAGFTNVNLSWSAVTSADHYFLIYQKTGETTWRKARPTGTSFTIEGLEELTEYRWGVSTFCNSIETIQSSFAFGNFTTTTGISCDTPSGLNATTGVSSNNLVNVNFTWDAVSSADHYLVVFRVIGSSFWQKRRPNTNSVFIDGLNASSDYEWGVKTFCDSDESVESAFIFDAFTTGAGNSCTPPTSLMATPGVSANSLVNVTLNWDAVPTADHYLVVYRIKGQSLWQKRRPNTNTIFINGLVANTQYEWGVFTECNADETAESTFSSGMFTTLNGASCNQPTGLTANPGANSVDLSWNSIAAADHFIVVYRVSGESIWQTSKPNSNSLSLQGLTEGTSYEWGVSTFCDAAETAQSPYSFSNFSTTVGSINQKSDININAKVFPNPTNLETNISILSSEDAFVTLKIYDNMGVLIAEVYTGELLGDRQYNFLFDTRDLEMGVYHYRLETNSGYKKAGRIIVN